MYSKNDIQNMVGSLMFHIEEKDICLISKINMNENYCTFDLFQIRTNILYKGHFLGRTEKDVSKTLRDIWIFV